MATDTHTGGIRPVTTLNNLPPMPAVTRILSRFDRDQLHGFIAVAIDLADALDGDPDEEPNGDDEHVIADGDIQDNAWMEWDQLPPSRRTQQTIGTDNEDDEAYGDEQDGNFAEDEDCAEFAVMVRGPGCEVSDQGGVQANEDDPSGFSQCGNLRGPGCTISDPAEDDDHAGGNVTDEPHDPEGDYDSGECLPGGGSGSI